MILVDTSIWIDFLRKGDGVLPWLLESAQVLIHPFVIGELALGNLKNRDLILGSLRGLPAATSVSSDEISEFIEQRGLAGSGIGLVDVHLLASAIRTADCRLWASDRRLAEQAVKMDIAWAP